MEILYVVRYLYYCRGNWQLAKKAWLDQWQERPVRRNVITVDGQLMVRHDEDDLVSEEVGCFLVPSDWMNRVFASLEGSMCVWCVGV